MDNHDSQDIFRPGGLDGGGPFDRQIRLPEIGPKGQRALARGGVLVVGAGGLGCAALTYLAAAGVGRLGIVEPDCIEPSNLHRQVLYTPAQTGQSKAAAARERLTALAPACDVQLFTEPLTSTNADALIELWSIVLDATDNFPTRRALGRACAAAGKPLVSAAVRGLEGQLTVFGVGGGPCYACLYPQAPADDAGAFDCNGAGVLGPVAGLLGTLQAIEAIKWLVGRPPGELLSGRLLLVDTLRMKFKEIAVEKNPNCEACASGPAAQPAPAAPANANPPSQTGPCGGQLLSAPEAARRLTGPNPPVLVDVREASELAVSSIQAAVHIPMGQLSTRYEELPAGNEVIVICRSGVRSAHAAAWLRTTGRFAAVHDLQGGIIDWADLVDPSVIRRK